MKLFTPAPVVLLVVLLTGTAINVENSGNPVDTPKEAYERVVESVKEGYANGVAITQEIYNKRFND
jgi:uncharacterized membrane protein